LKIHEWAWPISRPPSWSSVTKFFMAIQSHIKVNFMQDHRCHLK
jgi:hypothetical protein